MERLSVLENARRQALRRSPDSVQEETGNPVSPQLQAEWTQYIEQQRQQEKEILRQGRDEQAVQTALLARTQEKSRAGSVNGERRSTPESRQYAMHLQSLKKQEKNRTETNPDAFFVLHEQELLDDLANEREGRLVNVPYLKQAKKRMLDSLNAGIPVYLVGHLGSGKTQLALETAQDYACAKRRQAFLDEKMAAFEKEHAQASPRQKDQHFNQICEEARRTFLPGDEHPYFISGSHNLTAEDMFSEKTLKLAHASEGKNYEDQLQKLIQGFLTFLSEQEGQMEKMDSKERMSLMLAGWKTFSDLYISENSGFGTVVSKIDKEVLKALKEGKPVIIDEINTIAMQNLIALNDILQHHAGQTAYITGIGPVTIQNGFCLIGTGNLSTSTVSYEGTNVLNPAFQSRFTTIAYNYVPQSTTWSLPDQTRPEQNQLFRLMIEHLCQTDGSLLLPEPSKTLDQLFCLAQMARVSQDIFEGRNLSANKDGDLPVLNEAVLSIRGLIHILDSWNYGENCDLSLALWNGFIGSVTNGDDRNLLLALAVRYGFFPESEGWKIECRAKGEGALEYEDIRTQPYDYDIRALERLSKEDIIELLFGKGPKRTSLPRTLMTRVLNDSGEPFSAARAQKMNEDLRELEENAQILQTIEPVGQAS